eukprot:4856570-Alexandrium_andersonii.AAC.1
MIWYFLAMLVAGLPPLSVTAGQAPRATARPTARAGGPDMGTAAALAAGAALAEPLVAGVGAGAA